MTVNKIYWESLGVEAHCSVFKPQGKCGEYHAILQLDPTHDIFLIQLARLQTAERLLLERKEMRGCKAVMKRYFLSDAVNQAPLIGNAEEVCAVSNIQQPPLNGSKIGMWIYLVDCGEVTCKNNAVVMTHNGYEHIWQVGMMTNKGDSYEQTASLLSDYEQTLAAFDANIADNCIRTWFYVRDVDIQYQGLVRARRDNFNLNGLTQDTHYISSTGIAGLPSDPKAIIQLGTYALKGHSQQQTQFLYALTHLNRTIEYGVTFERGTAVNYGDRSHAYISGTASINNKGEVMYVGDVVKQTQRMWENVEKLLQENSMCTDDIMQIIVYLRDTADYAIVKSMFDTKFPSTPFIITLAPVCRPTWLIEMECIAVKERKNEAFRDF